MGEHDSSSTAAKLGTAGTLQRPTWVAHSSVQALPLRVLKIHSPLEWIMWQLSLQGGHFKFKSWQYSKAKWAVKFLAIFIQKPLQSGGKSKCRVRLFFQINQGQGKLEVRSRIRVTGWKHHPCRGNLCLNLLTIMEANQGLWDFSRCENLKTL